MDKVKEALKNPLYKKALIAVGVFIVILIIILIIASLGSNKTYTYEEFETKMITLAKSYYKNNENSLPADGERVSLSVQRFINNNSIKSLDKILPNGSNCQATVDVVNNNGFYLYVPDLNCGSYYETKSLNKLLKEQVTTNGNGLYVNGEDYIFKGDNVNNYIQINDSIWQIIKLNSDESVKIIDTQRSSYTSWDNRYNITENTYAGINDFIVNDINSRLKDNLDDYYSKLTDDIKAYFVKSALCVGKRSITDTLTDGSIECSNKIENQTFGLLQVNEYFNASLDANCNVANSNSCQNYNYLSDIGSTYTITADKDSTYKVFKLSSNGIELTKASTTQTIKVVGNIYGGCLIASGDGTEESPYIIK